MQNKWEKFALQIYLQIGLPIFFFLKKYPLIQEPKIFIAVLYIYVVICEANHILAKQVDHNVSREEQKRSRKNTPIITKYENTLPLIFRCAMLASLKSCLRFSHSLNPCFQDFTTLVLYCFRLLQLCHKTLSKTKTKKKKKTKTGTSQEC